MLGDQIRRIRKAEGCTIRSLSEKTGVSESYISQLERGLVDPSVSLLRRIAGALNVAVSSFFDEDGEAPIITRREDREQAGMEDGTVSFIRISPDSEHLKLEMVEVLLQARAQVRALSGKHYVNLFLTMGHLQLEYQNTVCDLQSGDSVFIPSHTEYILRCSGESSAAGILCTIREEDGK